MKALVSMGMILLLFSTCGMSSLTSFSSVYDELVSECMGDGNLTSYFGNTSRHNANWYVVKFSSESIIEIEELYVFFNYSSQGAREHVTGLILTNLTSHYRVWMHNVAARDRAERFFHVSIGAINYTYDTLEGENYTKQDVGKFWNFTLSPGTWYLICLVAETVESNIKIWLNTTTGINVLGTAEGNTTSLWSSEEFLGNLNVNVPRMVWVVNGKITMDVDNTFVGFWFADFYGWGGGNLRCADPGGNVTNGIFLQLFKTSISLIDCIIGGSGIWTIELNMLAFGTFEKGASIACSLLGADIVLP